MNTDVNAARNVAHVTISLIDKVALLPCSSQALKLVSRAYSNSRPFVVSFINAHAFNIGYCNRIFADSLLNSDLLFRDGVGMQILFKLLKKNPGANLNGTDIIPGILRELDGKSIALFGTKDPYLTSAANFLSDSGFSVISKSHGFNEMDSYVQIAQRYRPEIIILGMGMPRQEALSSLLKMQLDYACVIINGGAIIDFWAGRFKRAPKLVRFFKLEWAFRFILEPKRLFNRYIIGNCLFIYRALRIRKRYLAGLV